MPASLSRIASACRVDLREFKDIRNSLMAEKSHRWLLLILLTKG